MQDHPTICEGWMETTFSSLRQESIKPIAFALSGTRVRRVEWIKVPGIILGFFLM
jgi:hypothetical protein